MIYSQKRISTKYQKFERSQYLPYLHPRFSTLAIQTEPETVHGSINVPVYLSSTFRQKDINKFTSDFHYTRCGNPTREAVQKCIAKLEYGEYSLAFSSFCAAMSSIFHLIKTGEHVICCDDVYFAMRRYIYNFPELMYKIQVDYVNMRQIKNVKEKIKSNTTLIWIQTPINPTCKLIDLEEIGKLGRQHNILTVIDNSFASSYLQSPLLLGIDISLTSCTKYYGGHSDLVMGVLTTNKKQYYQKLTVILETQGTNPSVFDCYLVLRSLKTLQVRMNRICENAYTLAHYLENHPLVEKVYYAGLKSHPQHELALKQMRGFGGVVSFDMKGGRPVIDTFFKSLKIFKLAESFGGVQSLIEHPYYMADHDSLPVSLLDFGITEKLIRLSVGIQCLDDIIFDIESALQAATKKSISQ